MNKLILFLNKSNSKNKKIIQENTKEYNHQLVMASQGVNEDNFID